MSKYTIEESTLTGIADAIRSKEGTTEKIPVPNMKQRILDIQTGLDTSDATATEASVLDGDTFYADGEKKTGSMPRHTVDNNSVTWAITQMPQTDGNALTAVTIPEGHYEGGSYPTSPLAIRVPKDVTPGASDVTVQGGAWFTSSFKVKGDPNLVADNIKKGVSIFGVVGTHEGGSSVGNCAVTIAIADGTDNAIDVIDYTTVNDDGSIEAVHLEPDPTRSITVQIMSGSIFLVRYGTNTFNGWEVTGVQSVWATLGGDCVICYKVTAEPGNSASTTI